MSLKAFHVFFVAVSILLTVGFGVWAVRDFRLTDHRNSLYLGIASFAGTGVLVVYGVWFLRKLKGLSYI